MVSIAALHNNLYLPSFYNVSVYSANNGTLLYTLPLHTSNEHDAGAWDLALASNGGVMGYLVSVVAGDDSSAITVKSVKLQ